MKKMFLVSIVLAIIPSFLALASEYEIKGKAGDYNVEVRIDKNPLARGYNNMDVVITDAVAEVVTDAQVEIEYLMPSLPGKAPMMKYSTVAKPSDHHYLARLNLAMNGVWNIIISLTRARKTDAMEFTIVVQ
jgi:hypothetical protein